MSIDKSALTFDEFHKMCEEAGISSENKAEMEKDFQLGGALADVVTEVEMATERFPPMNSAHEGFAVLKEEVDELWDEVKKKQGERDIEKLRKEAVQVAAMAIRFIADVCTPEVAQN
jgi:hypothetical protein